MGVLLVAALLAAAPARGAEWHVAPHGADGAAGGAAAPWRTIQHAVRQVQPGDAVLVHPGTYVETVDLAVSGTAEAPITVRALAGAVLAAPAPPGSWEGLDVAAGVGHVVIEGFVVEGFAESILTRAGAHDVVVRDCVVRGGTVGIWIAGATRVAVERCELSGNQRGLRVSGAASAVTVRDTRSVGNDDGLGCSGDGDGFVVEETAADVVFEGCSARANGEDGFDLQGDAVVVARSESRDNGCSGLKLGQHARVENTLVAGNTTGIAVTSFFGAAVRTEIVNSTIADNSGAQLLLRSHAADPAAPSTVVLRNLIVTGPGKLLEAEWPLDLHESHSLFFRPDTTAGAIVRHLADGERRYSGQAINDGLWALESGQGSGTLAIDPRFVDRQGYAVAADSAAVDRGAAAAPPTDRHGVPRPGGAAVDIGADEAPGASGNHAPWADPGPERTLAVGARQRFLATGSVDPDGDPLTYSWDFGDGSAAAQGYSVAHAWAAPGDYVLTLTVSDGALQHARSAIVHVVVPTPTATPTATLTVTATATESATATETATGAAMATSTESPLPTAPSATATAASTATATPASTATATATATDTVTATGTETPTATPTPTPTPTEVTHDSRVDVPKRPLRLRIRGGHADKSRRLAVRASNDDTLPALERPGHAIQVVVEHGTCPPALRLSSAAFAARLGGRDTAHVVGGRRARALVTLVAAAADVDTPGGEPLHCTLVVRVLAPGDDPTPENNVATVAVEIVDDNDG